MKTLREKVQEARLLDRADALQRRLDAGFSLSRSEESERTQVLTGTGCPAPEPWSEEL